MGEGKNTPAALDIMLPDIDGFEVCRRIRATNKAHRHHHAHGPHAGDGQGHGPDDRRGRLCHQALFPRRADARIDALYRRAMRRGRSAPVGEISQQPFLLNMPTAWWKKRQAPQAHAGGISAILKLFMENPGKALTREEIPRHGLGPRLRRRGEDRGREHPPPAAEDRGRRAGPALHRHRLGHGYKWSTD